MQEQQRRDPGPDDDEAEDERRLGRQRRVASSAIRQITSGSQYNNKNNNNSPGHGPIGVLGIGYRSGSFWNVPRPRKVGGPGPSAAKVAPNPSPLLPANLRQGHGDLLFARDSFHATRKHL